MNGFGLVRDREIEPAGAGEGAFVRQNGREVVKVDRGLTGRIIGPVEAEGLVAVFVGTVAQQIDRCMGVAAPELREVQVHQVQAVHLFRDRSFDIGTGFGRDAWQRIELFLSVARKPSPPCDAEIAK